MNIVQSLRCPKESKYEQCHKCKYFLPQYIIGFCNQPEILEDAAGAIERLEAENAALREQMIEEIKRLEQKNTALYLQLDKVKKTSQVMEERANEISTEELLNVTAERDAALNDLRGKCSACVHYTWNHNEGVCAHCCREYMSNVIACSDCWQWRGPQKEDGENDE